MGFFSGIRRRIKKLIPKEVRPALPFILAATPLAGMSGPLAGIQSAAMRKAIVAGAAKGLSDDEAGIKDILRTSALAAAPDAISGGLGRAGDAAIKAGLPKTDGTFLLETGKMLKGGSDAVKGLGALKTVGAQTATDFGIKQAELNEKAIEEYNASLLSRGIRDKAQRRNAIFSIFVNNGYDEDEVNVMLDKYGYADGGKVKGEMMKAGMTSLEFLKDFEKRKKKRKKRADGGRIGLKGGGTTGLLALELYKTGNYTMEEAAETANELMEDEREDLSNLQGDLGMAAEGLEKAFGEPLGGRRPEPMRIIPGFASGGDVDEVMEFDEEIITPEYLMKEEGVPIQEQVSAPSGMDELNQLSLMLFNKPLGDLTEDEFERLQEFAAEKAARGYTQDEIDMYEQYKYDMNEQRPGMPVMEIDDFLRMELGAARLGVKKGGKVIKIMPEGVLYKGKAKDYPGIKQLIKDMKKKGTRNKKAKGGLMSMGGNELDLRGGGFVPMGKKERADDVPARLSKNEFVMTADAVRAAGGGSVQKGADLMYDTMKKLEAQS